MSADHQPQRRDKRYRTRLSFRTRVGGRVQLLLTEDVSYRGLYLCTDAPPPVRQLIRLETELPPNNVPFATHGMVVYAVAKDDPSGRTPGVGVQFYGMGDERRMWESFIQFIQWRSDQVPDRRSGQFQAAPPPDSPIAESLEPVVAMPTLTLRPATPATRARTSTPPPPARARSSTGPVPFKVAIGSGTHENRRFHRFPIVLEVCPRNLNELIRLYSRDVSVGGMFLPTVRDIPVASELRLEIRHPHADAVFPMRAIVRRRSTQPLGIGIEFVGLDDRRRRQFFEFIHAPPPLEADGAGGD